MSWRTKWKIREALRNSIWIVPAVFVALAIVLGIALPDLDKNTNDSIGLAFGAAAAQGMLGAMAGGMITFTGFVFSILLLAVQFGSSQFSPRMLRRFLRDPTTKVSLGMFMATFIYALFVLRAIQPANNDQFIPDFSVMISILLLLASMVMFLRLISRTTQGLRVASVLQDLGRDGVRELERCYPELFSADGDAVPRGIDQSGPVTEILFGEAEEPGILQSADFEGLATLARDAEVVLEMVPPIGDHLIPGDTLFRIHGEASGISEKILHESIAIADERTMSQDPAFIFRLLADISGKALSPRSTIQLHRSKLWTRSSACCGCSAPETSTGVSYSMPIPRFG
ncbi:MAG: DUF2254 domain-containing protein [Solirubrobacterales bacterium]|nr:DUF2254 domain-containing protein [Solirubrobacterales bacterium]